MNKYKLTIYWSEKDQSYLVDIPELDGCMTDGASYQDAVINAERAIAEWVETANMLGRNVPKPNAYCQNKKTKEKTNVHSFNKCQIGNFIPAVNYFIKVLTKLIIPAFDKYEEGTKDVNSSDYWDWDAGYLEYSCMKNVRQSVINLFAVALRHLYEQQVSELVMQSLDYDCSRKADYKIDEDVLTHADGIDVTSFLSWGKLVELKHVCNTVKHAEGGAAKKLEKLRPDLFKTPFQDDGFSEGNRLPVRQPLNGDGIFLQEKDIQEYARAIEDFWKEFIEKIESQCRLG